MRARKEMGGEEGLQDRNRRAAVGDDDDEEEEPRRLTGRNIVRRISENLTDTIRRYVPHVEPTPVIQPRDRRLKEGGMFLRVDAVTRCSCAA